MNIIPPEECMKDNYLLLSLKTQNWTFMHSNCLNITSSSVQSNCKGLQFKIHFKPSWTEKTQQGKDTEEHLTKLSTKVKTKY